ncbi:MAG: riboflavin biosynthesis protein RibF [Deferribacteraceae bacterium]|jgi:riboflavin kinase/FMN adenylyltransferase|nr:riboflavin biosynthesis protein RibF [Deferribacteraceae bacterium]
MEIIWLNGSEKPHNLACTVALGNFDGVHLGHQRLLARVVAFAQELGARPAVCTFYPHPLKYHKRAEPAGLKDVQLICSQEEKYGLLARYGIAACFVAAFDADFAALSPEEFVQIYIVEKMQAKAVVVGSDYNFGRDRVGTATVLKELCEARGIRCEVIERLNVDNEPVSSSRIRRMILAGDYDKLPMLLGRFMEYTGIVGHGEQLGTKIGYPTANMQLDNEILPPDGVYAGYTTIYGRKYPIMAYMGTRPTVSSSQRRGFEVNIIGYEAAKPLYGSILAITIIAKIRDGKKFASVDELKAQLAKDQQTAIRMNV